MSELAREIAEIRSGEREGPVSKKALYAYINATPKVLSLLYDIGHMPEQLEEGSVEWCYMERIVCWICTEDMRLAARDAEVRGLIRSIALQPLGELVWRQTAEGSIALAKQALDLLEGGEDV